MFPSSRERFVKFRQSYSPLILLKRATSAKSPPHSVKKQCMSSLTRLSITPETAPSCIFAVHCFSLTLTSFAEHGSVSARHDNRIGVYRSFSELHDEAAADSLRRNQLSGLYHNQLGQHSMAQFVPYMLVLPDSQSGALSGPLTNMPYHSMS
ncbi:hypothetical protein CY34DRAFT_262555 [Suillus luteus UH-Slu-Lm8-n1]|uniref:Uncharacterized protein n=1 Tax=Suillus luteus UH-Slu-Lm8-n1 TaxID=930992 RepID=A0A0D0AAJ5_9AGAM|nr:hypothetical protein CY34DRAFT_262555 [Suillus luteus UH-Slu-Lm8-n1]